MTQPPAPRSSPLALTVLALLHYQPLHPYGIQRLIKQWGKGIQRLIKQWGKDQVVNVEQRTSLYRTIERLLAAGLIAVRETGRDPRYPERTVYEVTEAGRQTARRWLEGMLAEPRQEYPEFPAALSHVLMLEPAELAEVLDRRAQRLAAMLAALDASTAARTRTSNWLALVQRPRRLVTPWSTCRRSAAGEVVVLFMSVGSLFISWSPDVVYSYIATSIKSTRIVGSSIGTWLNHPHRAAHRWP